jgi:acetyl-CoA carboxylase biotin carboxylase subunit
VLEEAPAPNLPEQARADILEACVHACQLMQYRGAGTFEFLFEDGEFFFIEMNTRVQVEHPVTEMVTGIDIIEQQLRIAAGLGLELQQEDIEVVVMRLNAVSMLKIQQHSYLHQVKLKVSMHQGAGIRLDSHIYQGYSIPPYYDSMIAKLIAHGKDRETSLLVCVKR